MTNALHGESTLARRRLAEAQNRFTEGATAFKARWATESADLTAQIGDRGGYLALLGDIESRGLPEHEGNFLKLLRSCTLLAYYDHPIVRARLGEMPLLDAVPGGAIGSSAGTA